MHKINSIDVYIIATLFILVLHFALTGIGNKIEALNITCVCQPKDGEK